MDNFVQYGTPLESLDENNIHLSKAPKLSDQVVKDKDGKRRFHGAFTGGFSAGYFNSVGTKEGWAPSSFVSSRSKRAEERVGINPVAFMDEEDLSYFGIASQRIQTSSRFEDPAEHSYKRKRSDDSGPIPGQPVLHDLLRPVNMTMGMKFLIKFGWRPGQGIGPRLSKRDKRKVRLNKANLSTEIQNLTDSDDDADNDVFSSLNFAPEDVEDSFLVNIKSNLFGLGYKPLERTNVLGHSFNNEPTSSFRMTEKNKKLSIRGQAFGVGAFEDDDEDIYMKEDMSDYDFDLGPSKSNTNQKRSQSRWDNKILAMEETLEGFHLSSKPLEKPKKIPLPLLPSDYKPWHESWKSRFDERKVVGKERLTSDERKHLVSDNLSVNIRSDIKKDEKELCIDDVKTSTVPQSLETPENVAFTQYKPFAAYPEKQKRYELYFRSNCNDKDNIFPSYMTEWEKEREKGEFQRAQAFNRPMSFSISSRFTTAVHQDKANNLQEGFNDMKNNKPIPNEDEVPYFGSELPDDMNAAKQSSYGRLTQTHIDWFPDKLLCKRFNVPNPFSSSSTVGTQSKRKERLSLFSIIPEVPQNNFPQAIFGEKGIVELADNCNVVEESVPEEENYGLKVPVGDHPTIDLYNAIFQDSSDSESEEGNNSENELSSVNEKKSTSFKDVSEARKSTSEKSSHFKNSKESNEHENETRKGINILISGEQNNDFSKSENMFSSLNSKDNLQKSMETRNPSKTIEAKGIFKGIDFSTLSQYRNINNEESSQNSAVKNELDISRTRRNGINTDGSCSSDSTNSSSNMKNTKPNSESEEESEEEEYGPSLPPHMIKGAMVSEPNTISVMSDIKKDIFKQPISTSLLEIEKKLKKIKKQKKKHKHKHKKHKKESKHRK